MEAIESIAEFGHQELDARFRHHLDLEAQQALGAAFVLASIDDPESDEAASDYTDLGFGGVGSIGYDTSQIERVPQRW